MNDGALYLLQENWPQAIALFDRILQRNPTSIPALSNKLYCLYHSGKLSESRRVAKDILFLKPDDEQARFVLESTRGK